MAEYAIIACRLPNGLIVGDVGHNKPIPPVTLNGSNASNALHGFGFTRVDADFARAWLGPKGPGSEFAVAKQGGLFVAKNIDEARARVREMVKEVDGFAPLDPDKPLKGIEPTDEMKKTLKKVRAEKEEDPDALKTDV